MAVITNEQLDKALDIVGGILKLMDSKPHDVVAKRKYTKRLTKLNQDIKKGKTK